MEIIEIISNIFLSFGIDILLVGGIIFTTQLFKLFQKPEEKYIYLFMLIQGIAILIFQAINGLPMSEWVRIGLGYPAIAVGAYKLIGFYFPRVKEKLSK